MSELIQYQRDDGIVTLTLNSPETRNPISDDDMIEALLAALERLETDPDARVAILTGAGSAFSSGGNVKKMGAAGGPDCTHPMYSRAACRRSKRWVYSCPSRRTVTSSHSASALTTLAPTPCRPPECR